MMEEVGIVTEETPEIPSDARSSLPPGINESIALTSELTRSPACGGRKARHNETSHVPVTALPRTCWPLGSPSEMMDSRRAPPFLFG